jgi:hypothetical protein
MSKHMPISLGGVPVQKFFRDIAKAITCPALFCGKDAVVSALRLEDGQAPFTLSMYS